MFCMGGDYDAPHVVHCSSFILSDKRTRIWAFIVYPDSVRSDWLDILRDLHVDIVVSPLHSPDLNPSVEENNSMAHKKEHYHVMVMFDGVKTSSQVSELFSVIGSGVSKPIYVHSSTGYTRYMVHVGYPDKEQFENPASQLTYFGNAGSKVAEAFELQEFDAIQIIGQINQFIVDNDIREFDVLYQYCIADMPKWAYVLDKYNCRSVHALLSSKRWGGRRS